MIGCLRTLVCKQPIIALYFESENELKFYNLETRKCYNLRLQTEPQHHDQETRNTDSHKSIKVKLPALFLSMMIAELERASRTKLENNGQTQNSHNQWKQQQSYHIYTVFHLFLDFVSYMNLIW